MEENSMLKHKANPVPTVVLHLFSIVQTHPSLVSFIYPIKCWGPKSNVIIIYLRWSKSSSLAYYLSPLWLHVTPTARPAVPPPVLLAMMVISCRTEPVPSAPVTAFPALQPLVAIHVLRAFTSAVEAAPPASPFAKIASTATPAPPATKATTSATILATSVDHSALLAVTETLVLPASPTFT